MFSGSFLVLQLTDDDEALQDEEEEAQLLQRQAAEQLRPEDFEQDEEDEGANSSEEEEPETMDSKARQVYWRPLGNKMLYHSPACKADLLGRSKGSADYVDEHRLC